MEIAKAQPMAVAGNGKSASPSPDMPPSFRLLMAYPPLLAAASALMGGGCIAAAVPGALSPLLHPPHSVSRSRSPGCSWAVRQ